ncbi:zinc ABC transporter substrate-binding protein [Arcobacter sp. s6]|uniref:metal ABC transporter solute-binding protein, Zn/Mn family n=1 Tax=Arcobacter sp. s6 TaxID=3230363 RepID=UPI00349FE85C
MKKILFLFISIIGILNASTQQITVSILPQKYFVEKITKDKFEVNVMVQPGASPHTYEPKTSQMKALAASKVYFATGVSFEHVWLDKFKKNAKDTLFVDLSNGIEKLAMGKHEHHEDEAEEHEHEGHDDHKGHEKHDDHDKHGHEAKDNHDAHDEDGLDPHIWLDPILVKIQAKNIYETMLKIDAQNGDFYKENYEQFLKELDELDANLKTILTPFKDKAFMVFHPSWGYFAKRYDLEQIPIELQGKEPKPNELVDLIKDAKEHDIKIVFVSPQFSQKSAKTISQNINAKVATINPMVENWSEGLILTAKEIASSYSK